MWKSWSTWICILVFLLGSLFFPKLSRFLHAFVRKLAGFKVTGEGEYLRSKHICQAHRVSDGSHIARGEEPETYQLCCQYIFLKEHPEDKEEKVCIVRNICHIPFALGTRIRVSHRGGSGKYGKYKVEEVKNPA